MAQENSMTADELTALATVAILNTSSDQGDTWRAHQAVYSGGIGLHAANLSGNDLSGRTPLCLLVVERDFVKHFHGSSWDDALAQVRSHLKLSR